MASQWNPPLPPGYEARWDPNQRAYFYINHHDKSTSWQDPRFAQPHQAAVQAGLYNNVSTSTTVTSQPHGRTLGLLNHTKLLYSFYINHHDKSTSWQDPRFAQPHQAAAQFLNQPGFGARPHGAQNIPMQTKSYQFGSTTSTDMNTEEEEESDTETDFDTLFASTTGDQGKKVDIQKLHKIRQMFPSAPEDIIKELLLRNNNVEHLTNVKLINMGYKQESMVSHPPPRAVDMLERLHAMFPTANKELVADILSQADNDERKARIQLEAIGYKATYPTTHKDTSRSTSPAHGKSPSRQASPAKRSTSPAKPSLSDAEKSRLVNKVNQQFPKVSKSVVEMALQVCNYDETRVKAVLDRMAGTSQPSSSRPSTSTSNTRTRSVSPKPQISHNLEPVIFSDDVSRPSSTSTGKKSRSMTPSGSRPQSSSRSATPKSSKSSTQQQRAKQVTQTQRQTVVARQPRSAGSMSEHRTQAKGPDPSLRVGPNKELLLTEYTQAHGPNPELRHGPDPDRVQGSQGAVGPDRSLHCGPQLGIQQGPGDRRPLVTAI